MLSLHMTIYFYIVGVTAEIHARIFFHEVSTMDIITATKKITSV